MNYLSEKDARIETAGGYRMKVTFRDGFAATVDLAPLLDEGPIFARWRYAAFFCRGAPRTRSARVVG
jgi:hypothetical protein